VAISLYLYSCGYINSTYTLVNISPYLYPYRYITQPIPLWIYHHTYTFYLVLCLHSYIYLSVSSHRYLYAHTSKIISLSLYVYIYSLMTTAFKKCLYASIYAVIFINSALFLTNSCLCSFNQFHLIWSSEYHSVFSKYHFIFMFLQRYLSLWSLKYLCLNRWTLYG